MQKQKLPPDPPKFAPGDCLKLRLNGEVFPLFPITARRALDGFGIWEYKILGIDRWIWENDLMNVWENCRIALIEFEAQCKLDKGEVTV